MNVYFTQLSEDMLRIVCYASATTIQPIYPPTTWTRDNYRKTI